MAVVATFAPALSSAQSNFPDVPDNHWSYEALAWLGPDEPFDILDEVGLLNWRRYFPQMAYPSRTGVDDLRQEFRDKISRLDISLASANAVSDLQRAWYLQMPIIELMFVRLFKATGESSGEFSELRKSLDSINLRYAERGMPVDENRFERFTDLECGNWANLAIKRMRDRGILRGYPDGTYRG